MTQHTIENLDLLTAASNTCEIPSIRDFKSAASLERFIRHAQERVRIVFKQQRLHIQKHDLNLEQKVKHITALYTKLSPKQYIYKSKKYTI